ncbi:MAG TPA: hypothetical protein ENH02_05635 [Bacteroidetes bacterium]|nr:hypothetical protein [Bacteroidota bacterium]
MKFKKPLLLLFFGLIFLPGLKAQKVKTFILKAPEKPFYDVKKIGVLKFECSTNRRKDVILTNYIVADLLNQHRGIYNKKGSFYGIGKSKEGKTFVKGVTTDFYEVIERDQLEKIMKEQRLSLSGAIDENSAAEVGKLLGLDVLIIGNASYSHNDEWSNSELTGRCLKRTVTAKGTMKIISVKTARIVGTKTASASFKDSGCGDKVSGVMTTDQLADVSLKQLAKDFVDYFTPGYEHMVFNMEKVKIKELKDKAKEAMNFLKKGDLDHAFPIVYAMYEADSYNPKAAYNLGVLYEMVGAYEEAAEYYGIAYDLDYSNGLYQKAAERAKAGIALAGYLEDIGRPVQPYSFTGGGNALAERVKIKGSSADRVAVYSLPDKSSEVVAKVPGGLEFKVLGQEGKFIEIQLRGSKTGYVPKSNVK